jgi:hypothetical protein
METSFLMLTILRIGSLMKVGFGSAGVEIIATALRTLTTRWQLELKERLLLILMRHHHQSLLVRPKKRWLSLREAVVELVKRWHNERKEQHNSLVCNLAGGGCCWVFVADVFSCIAGKDIFQSVVCFQPPLLLLFNVSLVAKGRKSTTYNSKQLQTTTTANNGNVDEQNDCWRQGSPCCCCCWLELNWPQAACCSWW